MERGFVVGARNELVGKAPEQESPYLDIIAGMHAVEACYDADEEAGDTNEQVQATIRGGIEVTELDWRTPSDVITYTGKKHDFKHSGGALRPTWHLSFIFNYLLDYLLVHTPCWLI
eukprot:12420486-Karenia_brevis.AAC.1